MIEVGRLLDLVGIRTPVLDGVQLPLFMYVHSLNMLLHPLLHLNLQVVVVARTAFH